MKFAVVGEGLTDIKVLRNLLTGFFNDKNLPVTKLLPKDKEPVGWPGVLKYLSTEDFRKSFEFNDYCIIQIDTDKCEDWRVGLRNICSDVSKIDDFINEVKNALIIKIGSDYYNSLKDRIIFAISVHEIECWLLPFNSSQKAKYSKIVTCSTAIEEIANRQGFSIKQKNYQDGKFYDELSKEMRTHRELLAKAPLNPSLNIFIDNLSAIFN